MGRRGPGDGYSLHHIQHEVARCRASPELAAARHPAPPVGTPLGTRIQPPALFAMNRTAIPDDAVVELRGARYRYPDGAFSLEVADLTIARGERVAITGPSGTGKTTLLHLVAGILQADAGRVHVAGLELTELGEEDRSELRILRLGLVFQEFELLEYLNVLDNVLLPFRISAVRELTREVRNRAEALLGSVGLGDKLRRHPSRLSQGERQRVAVARALVTEPALILGDEPTGNLDPENRDLAAEMLFDYSAATGAPLLIATHDSELVSRFERHIDVRELG